MGGNQFTEERAEGHKKSNFCKRAIQGDGSSQIRQVNRLCISEPDSRSSPINKRSIETMNREKYEANRQMLKMMVRARDDFQDMRTRMDNRLGVKADGSAQQVEDRNVDGGPAQDALIAVADTARDQETALLKSMGKLLKTFPIYTEFLASVKGCGPASAGWIISSYDIYKADTVSKLWQFTGLNPGMVPGKKRVEGKEKGEYTIVATDQMVRGDKLTPGFVAPFNKRLRAAVVGVMADSFIKCKSEYARYYYEYKARLEQEQNKVGGNDEAKSWCDESKGHRDRAAKRYMIKMFLKDLYVQWRTLHGLPVRVPYAEEYLGKKHSA
jgi:hypothetical protein